MTAFCRAYPDLIAAGQAIEALRATGVPHDAIRLISGRRPRDLRTESAGGFAGPMLPDAPVGTFGGRLIRRRDGAGTFAGDARTQRQGSFADSDHAEIVDYGEGGERTRVTGLRGVRRLLGRAALDPDAVDRAVTELHKGHTLVLVDLPADAAGQAADRLEQLGRAA